MAGGFPWFMAGLSFKSIGAENSNLKAKPLAVLSG